MTDAERRAPMQGDWAVPSAIERRPGTISWDEHVEIWTAYGKKYGHDQSAERIAERQGFGYSEAAKLLGHEPRTWRPL